MARILVVDDERQILQMMQQMLRREGHEAHIAATVDDAMRHLGQRQIDVVITDIIMPDKEGVAFIADPGRQYPQVRTIAISGGGRINPDFHLNYARQVDATRVLRKPFTQAELFSVLDDALADTENAAPASRHSS